VLPLDEYLPPEYLAGQAAHQVGGSHDSYFYNGHQWALAIDAAAPAASYRADLIGGDLPGIPETWADVLQLARKGRVAVPAIPIDLLMNFYTFCIAHGATPFVNQNEITDRVTGIQVLDTMRELYSLIDTSFFSCNPIAVAERMSSTDDYWYCPFAYCYSNYSRRGYAKQLLTYTNLVSFNGGPRLRGTIGGTGLAVSAHSKNRDMALKFAQWLASPGCQSTLYTENGGQPGHRMAWTSPRTNYLTNGFFITLLPLMDNGYIRPRYHGYLYFQDHAGAPLQAFLQKGGSAANTLDKMNAFYQASFNPIPQT
jgi:multiple sugar transport system substrate-binding protein